MALTTLRVAPTIAPAVIYWINNYVEPRLRKNGSWYHEPCDEFVTFKFPKTVIDQISAFVRGYTARVDQEKETPA